MLAPLSSLEAYRRDAVATDGVGPDDSTAASWLEAASRIEHAAMVKGAERERLLASFLVQRGVVAFQATPVAVEAVVAAVVSIVRSMEDSAYFRMAYSTLSALCLVIPEEAVLTRGQVMVHKGRMARHLAEVETAAQLYRLVEEMGCEHNLPDLTGRAWNGLGVLAEYRGDFPEARRRFTAILELPGAAPEIVSGAHQQLMIAAATAKDYDRRAACMAGI
jgi:hypothetical protein